MLSLVYISRASEKLSDASLVELLEISRDKNERAGITGMLLYKDGNFMQLLEGEEDAVRALFQKIEGDERHCNVIVLMEDTLVQRHFDSWSMGFQNLRKVDLSQVPGYSEFLDVPLVPNEFTANLSRGRDLLLLFRRVG